MLHRSVRTAKESELAGCMYTRGVVNIPVNAPEVDRLRVPAGTDALVASQVQGRARLRHDLNKDGRCQGKTGDAFILRGH